MNRCQGCGLGILDPRPTPDSLPEAYDDYHTHEGDPSSKTSGGHSLLGSVRRRIGRSMARQIEGYERRDPSRLVRGLAAVARHVPSLRRRVTRFLPPFEPSDAPPGRLLDAGCGDGWFLDEMEALGWNVHGQEQDPQAAEAARARGHEVHVGPLDELDSGWDVVTCNHVLEHVPDPRGFLQNIFDLLEDDGCLWAATPNFDSVGHEVFGPAWRGLEPPRHLHVFTIPTLEELAREVGFSAVEVGDWRPSGGTMWDNSRALLDSYPANIPDVAARPFEEVEPEIPDGRHDVISLLAMKGSG